MGLFGFGKKKEEREKIPATQIRVKCTDKILPWFNGLKYEDVEPWRIAHLCHIGSQCKLGHEGEIMTLKIVGLEPPNAEVYLTRDTELVLVV